MIIQFSPNDDILDIRFDNIFKAIFTKDTPKSRTALGTLISAAIGFAVTVEEILQNEPAPEDIRDRQIRFDIHCRAKNGQLVNVEMTMYPDKFEPLRIEFFACKLFTSQNIRGASRTYANLKHTYQISILAKNNLGDDQNFFHHFRYYDSDAKVALGGRSNIITIELVKADLIADKNVDEMSAIERWAMFLKHCADPDKRVMVNQILKSEEGISMAAETLLEVSTDEHERARLLTEYKILLDYQCGLAAAEQDGREKGRQEGKITTAVNVIKLMNLTVNKAMEICQLDSQWRTDLIAKLREQEIIFTE
jgi:predicted transposase/invertase (TIGR01784 family)